MELNQIITPSLIINKNICLHNIHNMQEKAIQNQLNFRPHFKTHQSKTIGQWFKQAGIDKITVSSVSMAQYFAEDNWKDITIAFPVNIREINAIDALARNTSLNLTVENTESVVFLARQLKNKVGIFIKIDTGYNRTGVSFDIFIIIDKILKEISNNDKLEFKGFLSHAGHTYKACNKEEILDIHQDSLHKLSILKKHYIEKYPNLIMSIGDTPANSLTNSFFGIDEIRPGNFVFYDLMQYKLGSCNFKQVATTMACPVVAKHKERMEIIIYGGGVHFSKEYIKAEGKNIYGLVVSLDKNGWNELPHENYLVKLSQEHGTIQASEELFKQCQIGDLVGIIPVHSCLAANLMKDHFVILE